MVWRNYPYRNIADTVPPHDIQDRDVADYLPSGEGSSELKNLMARAREIIASSPEIADAMGRYQGTPESIWLWGGGKKPEIKTLRERFGLHGYTISAVNLIHGIGKAAGLEPITVDGATGYIDTNYEGKASALISSMKNCNYVFLHVEAPDESGHEGSIEKKLKSVEDFDKRVVGPVIEAMEKYNNFSILLMPDHHTPVSVKTHTSDPVPFCIYSKGNPLGSDFKKFSAPFYNEKTAEGTGLFVKSAHQLIEIMTNESI
jgi:2,3-bisphosphoglycerate-independent phosphoglycerate mutase